MGDDVVTGVEGIVLGTTSEEAKDSLSDSRYVGGRSKGVRSGPLAPGLLRKPARVLSPRAEFCRSNGAHEHGRRAVHAVARQACTGLLTRVHGRGMNAIVLCLPSG